MLEGTISEVSWCLGSGLAVVEFTDGTTALLDAGFGLRVLMEALGGSPTGKTIRYAEENGAMSSFEVV